MNTHGMSIIEVPCDAIRIGERHRKDLGDLEALAASIATDGLLQPVGITENNVMVFGERRFRACRDISKWTTIQARVVSVRSIAAGEYAENVIRKDFTLSERVAIGKASEVEIGKRQGQRSDKELPPNLAEVALGVETRHIAAQKAGSGGHSIYEQAKKVVEKAVEEIVAQMDAGRLAISPADLVAEETPERQRETAGMESTKNNRKPCVRSGLTSAFRPSLELEGVRWRGGARR